MSQLKRFVMAAGKMLPLPTLIVVYFALSAFWNTTLSVIEAQFTAMTAGGELLDTQLLFSPEPIIQQAAMYTDRVRTLLWSFFILDSFMPQLVFGLTAVLWAALWIRDDNRLYRRLLSGGWVLFPLGVGLWDWLENILWLPIVQSTIDASTALPTLWMAVVSHNLKIAFVIPTALLTYVFLGRYLFTLLRRLYQHYARRAVLSH
jgi:hypothetical protein